MYHHQSIPCALIICPTEFKRNKFYANHIPAGYIYKDFESGVIRRLLNRQENIMDKMEKKPYLDPHVLFVMDDCAHDKSWIKDKNIREIFTNGRHYKILYITAIQDPMVLQPFMRGNVDFVFLLQENDRAKLKRIWNAYGQVFETFDGFLDVFRACTKNFGCMVIDNASKSTNLSDICFHYKATYNLPPFKLGCRTFWKYDARHYNEDYNKKQLVGLEDDGKKVRVQLQS